MVHVRSRILISLFVITAALLSCRIGYPTASFMLSPTSMAEATGAPIPAPTAIVAATGAATTVPVPAQTGVRPTETDSTQVDMTAVRLAIGTPEGGSELGVTLDATFEGPEGFFALDYPQDWTISAGGWSLLADEGGAGLSTGTLIKAVSAETLATRSSNLYADSLQGYQEVSRYEGTLSGYPAVWVEQTFSSEGVPHRGLMAVAVRNQVGFELFGWAPEGEYPTVEPALRAMIGSVRIREFGESPPYVDWITHETVHMAFHSLPGTWSEQNVATIADVHEQAFTDNVSFLEVDYEGPIDVYLYPSEESFYRATARRFGFAITDASEVHTRWFSEDDHQTPGHEITHVITFQRLGDAHEALMGEGIAVWLDHGGNDYHAFSADLLATDQLVPLYHLLGDGSDGSAAAYYEAGSFVGFLLDRSDPATFRQVYTSQDLDAALQQVFGADLVSLEKRWITTLRILY